MRSQAESELRFSRRWHKYYLADEVDHHLQQINDNAGQTQRQLDDLTARLHNMEQTKSLASAGGINQQNESIIEEQVREISALGNQLSALRSENTEKNEQLAQQNLELARLHKKIDNLTDQVARLESQSTEEMVQQAIIKADQIVSKANAESKRMLQQTTEQRAQLLAVCRAAYYSALQFKKDLAEQFRGMEKDLDASIDALQLMDHTPLTLDSTVHPNGVDEEQDTILP